MMTLGGEGQWPTPTYFPIFREPLEALTVFPQSSGGNFHMAIKSSSHPTLFVYSPSFGQFLFEFSYSLKQVNSGYSPMHSVNLLLETLW